jgi:hypothetical protein
MKEANTNWVAFQYEKLPKFCFLRQNLEVMHLYIYIPKHSAVGGKAVSSKSGGANVSDIFK